MRTIGLIIGALLVSVNCSASTISDIKSAIIEKSVNQTHSNSHIIYGGQDISRPVIATANESLWTGETQQVG